jgi:hypothetical protein
VVYGINPECAASGRFLFLDFANTMNMGDRWVKDGKEDWKQIQEPGFPPIMIMAIDKGVLESTVKKLLALPDETIRQIVERIDPPFLSDRYKKILVQALVGRKNLVADFIIKQYIKGGL